MTGVHVILVTAPSPEAARTLSRTLVSERHAACVNILPGLTSIYRWEGAVEEEVECLLLIKTDRARFDEVQERVKELHPYDEPEILGIEVSDGSHSYLKWVLDETRAPKGIDHEQEERTGRPAGPPAPPRGG